MQSSGERWRNRLLEMSGTEQKLQLYGQPRLVSSGYRNPSHENPSITSKFGRGRSSSSRISSLPEASMWPLFRQATPGMCPTGLPSLILWQSSDTVRSASPSTP